MPKFQDYLELRTSITTSPFPLRLIEVYLCKINVLQSYVGQYRTGLVSQQRRLPNYLGSPQQGLSARILLYYLQRQWTSSRIKGFRQPFAYIGNCRLFQSQQYQSLFYRCLYSSTTELIKSYPILRVTPPLQQAQRLRQSTIQLLFGCSSCIRLCYPRSNPGS